MNLVVNIIYFIFVFTIGLNVLIKMFNINEMDDHGARIFLNIFKTFFIIFQQLTMISIMLFISIFLYDYFRVLCTIPKLSIYLFIVIVGALNLRVTSIITFIVKSTFNNHFNLHKKLIHDGCLLFNSFFRLLVYVTAAITTFIVNISVFLNYNFGFDENLWLNSDAMNYGIVTLLAIDQVFENAHVIPNKIKVIIKEHFNNF